MGGPGKECRPAAARGGDFGRPRRSGTTKGGSGGKARRGEDNMATSTGARCIGILTSGGDCPGLNAAIRGVAKPAISDFHIEVIGIEKGFRGLVENHSRVLHQQDVSNILATGGTILGSSREKP